MRNRIRDINLEDLVILQSLFEAEDIKFAVHNTGIVKKNPAPSEIWILDAKQYENANKIVQAYYKNKVRSLLKRNF